MLLLRISVSFKILVKKCNSLWLLVVTNLSKKKMIYLTNLFHEKWSNITLRMQIVVFWIKEKKERNPCNLS